MLYFENRKLRKTIDNLDNAIAAGETKRDELQTRIGKLEGDVKKLTSSLRDNKANHEKTKQQLREQTGADLLVNALRELGVIPPREKEPDHFAEAGRLQSQLAQAGMQAQNPGNPFFSQPKSRQFDWFSRTRGF